MLSSRHSPFTHFVSKCRFPLSFYLIEYHAGFQLSPLCNHSLPRFFFTLRMAAAFSYSLGHLERDLPPPRVLLPSLRPPVTVLTTRLFSRYTTFIQGYVLSCGFDLLPTLIASKEEVIFQQSHIQHKLTRLLCLIKHQMLHRKSCVDKLVNNHKSRNCEKLKGGLDPSVTLYCSST